MYIQEKGVLSNSNIYFHTPSSIARSAFFYLKCAGEFFCDETYLVERDTFYSYLIMYIKKGNGGVSSDNKSFSARTNDVVLLNCHQHHQYYTSSGWETLWIHFDGNSSHHFFELLYSRFGLVLSLGESSVIQRYLSMIIDGFKSGKPLPEALVSCYIQRMLTEMLLISSNYNGHKLDKISPVIDAITFIETNFKERITIDDLASYVKVSPFHFSRVFKKETGYSPYEYIIKTRIDRAKFLLKKTGFNIKEIAFEVGFNSESNFVNTFRGSVNLTPNEFRNTPL